MKLNDIYTQVNRIGREDTTVGDHPYRYYDGNFEFSLTTGIVLKATRVRIRLERSDVYTWSTEGLSLVVDTDRDMDFMLWMDVTPALVTKVEKGKK